ncbi:AAA family ATPase [Candidatus Kaiserbacteria bacterium]|nr:AAA family ATPase [Candidatus Kaiserbacteria bacterium]USN89003.1 MAG: AAA family ATPase [Candidatus Nomurabacteria bacterium]
MLVGITGSFGAGKGFVANYLVQKKSFKHYSARALITEVIAERGLPINRDTMTEVANDLRAKGGPTYIFERLVAKAKAEGGDAVVESIRAVAEATYMKEQGGIVLGIDADPKLRFERIQKRGSETDKVTFTEWLAQEEREMHSDDPTKQNIAGVMQIADVVIKNNGSLGVLTAEIDNFIATHHG